MHRRWLGVDTGENFLLPLKVLGLNMLGFALNLSSPDWPATHLVIEACRQLGLGSVFTPYEGPYNPAGFSRSMGDTIKRLYEPAIE